MELEELRNCMKQILSDSRYRHSLGVEEVAYDLALIYGYDPIKASITGILHDCAKPLTEEEVVRECEKHRLPISEVEYKNPFLLHAKVGAVYARDKYGVADEDILRAIIYHTTGRPGMSLLEKIIFTADFIEPYRKQIPKLMEARQAAYENLDKAIIIISKSVLDYLKSTGAAIDTLTKETYDYYRKDALGV